MADTHRNIRGIDTAGQKDLWARPANPKASGGNSTKTSGDNKANQSKSASLPATKSLTDK